MEHLKQLGEDKIFNLLWRFSVPAIVGMMVNALYNVVDRIFIGHGIGSEGIAGITIGFPLMLLIMAFIMLVGIGAAAQISIRLGEQKKDEAELILGNCIWLLVLVSVGLTIFGLVFLDPLLKLFGASRVILPYARDYMQIILVGAIFQAIGFGLNNIIRADGSPRIAMLTMLMGAVLNALLCPVFIFWLKMGMRGAALATIISQGLAAVWVLAYFFGKHSHLKVHWSNLKLKTPVVVSIFTIGFAPFGMQVAASVLNIILNNSLEKYGGDKAISAMGIVFSILMLILMPIFGINQGVQPIIGYNYGAKKFDRVKQALKLAVLAATAIVVVGFIMIRVIPEQLISLFNDQDTRLLELGINTLQVFLLMLPIIGFQIVSANYFQAVGKPVQAMVLSLSRQVLLLIPALLILPRFFGLNGVLAAGPVSDFGSSLVTGVWLFFELKHLDLKHSESQSLEVEYES
jgi:putative MATE family efflux protein